MARRSACSITTAKNSPTLKDKLIVALHGYRPTGSRVLVYDTDAHGFPTVSAPPVRYNVSCAASEMFAENGKPIPASPYVELISGWHKVNGVRPQGAPVGMAVAADGAIWLAEDKNQTIIRIDAEPEAAAVGPLPCGKRTPAQIADSRRAGSMKDAGNRKRLTQVRAQLIERRCIGCHADFDIKRGHERHAEGYRRAAVHAGAGELDLSGQSRGRPAAQPRLGQGRRKGHAGGWARTDRERTGLQGVVDDAR